MSEATARHCVSCGAAVSGRYCPECGESAVHHDYSMSHFAEELAEEVTHVDGRAWWSFRALLLRPGQLARDFLDGRRKRQFGPIRLFVICNIVYFLAQPFTLFAPFTSTLQIQTTARPWKDFARGLVDAKTAARHQTFEQYAVAYDETAHLQGKTLVFLMVPMFALGAWALHPRTRRFFAEHLVVSFYTYAFLLLWFGFITFVLSKVFIAALRSGFQASGDELDNVATLIITVPFAVYLLLTDRKVYDESWPKAIVKAAILTGWSYAVLTAYRFILFFTAFYAT
jgi:hypothetical protein